MIPSRGNYYKIQKRIVKTAAQLQQNFVHQSAPTNRANSHLKMTRDVVQQVLFHRVLAEKVELVTNIAGNGQPLQPSFC